VTEKVTEEVTEEVTEGVAEILNKNNNTKKNRKITIFMNHIQRLAILCASKGFGGLEMNAVRLAQWLQDLGHFNVAVIGFEGTPVMQMAQEVGLSVAYTKPYAKYADIRGARRFGKLLCSLNATAVFTANNKDLSMLSMLKNILRSKVKVIYQQQMDLVIDKKDLIHTFRFSAIDLWIAPLENIKNDVLQHTRVPASKIQVIPLGVDVETFLAKRQAKTEAQKQLKLTPTYSLLGIMGRIDQQKGQLVLLQALQILKERGVDTELLIAGELTRGETQEYMESLQNFVAQHQLENRVHFRPFMKDVETFYSAIDVFVMATHRETYGMVTCEAMLYGLPIVGSNAGGTVSLLSHYDGYSLFKPQNAEDLAEKLQQLLNNIEQAKLKAQQASGDIKKYLSHVEECSNMKTEIDKLYL
jgi:glycosyltransferase involved in cell wall biosynthesis